MKSLILVRHAKSDWDDPSLQDFDRPLNDRGKRDAPMMALRLLEKKVKIDAFIASPAKRARKTAEAFVKEFKKDKGDILFIDKLYLAEPATFRQIIAEVDNDYNTIAVFSHNAGLTDYANTLTDVRIDNIPTCAYFAVKANVKKWKDFEEADKDFWFFDSPKAGLD